MHLSDVLIVSNKFLEENADVLSNDGIELLNVFTCYFLIVFDNSVKVVASDSYFIEDQLEEKLQQSKDVLSLYLFVLAILENLLDLFDHNDEVLLVIVVDAVNELN